MHITNDLQMIEMDTSKNNNIPCPFLNLHDWQDLTFLHDAEEASLLSRSDYFEGIHWIDLNYGRAECVAASRFALGFSPLEALNAVIFKLYMTSPTHAWHFYNKVRRELMKIREGRKPVAA